MTETSSHSRPAAQEPGVSLTDYTLGSDAMVWWTTPILRRLCDPESKVCEELKALVLDKVAAGDTIQESNEEGWRSDDDLLKWDTPEIAQFQDWIVQATHDIIAAISGGKIFRGNLELKAWANLSRRGQYTQVQTNPGYVWSGVYYVEAGDVPTPDHPKSGALEFLDPRAGAEMITLPGKPFGQSKFYTPKTGELFVFPSWLKHMVHPYWGDGNSISIAFNARFRPNVGRRRR